MLDFIRSLHGGVRFSYVPYVVHPFISRYSPVTTITVPAPHPFIIRSYPLYISFSPFINVYHPLRFVKFCQIWHRIRTSKNV